MSHEETTDLYYLAENGERERSLSKNLERKTSGKSFLAECPNESSKLTFLFFENLSALVKMHHE